MNYGKNRGQKSGMLRRFHSANLPHPSEGGRHFRPFSLIRQIFENALFFPVRNLYENIRKGAATND
ncbi:MAG: hypothetical protein B6245_01315 [Desulfobacteraceae bacterium 4572_88]|nr:MAG: hypothetical protein B6245_01315 [Desulfobacteraceae bacterium 4572_88]